MSDWVSQFKAHFSDAVWSDNAEFAIQNVEPACVAAPANEAQAAEMIRFAASNKIPVVPCGGGASQGRCAPPPAGFLAISTNRLNKLIHHEPGDMVATVQSGMDFGHFQRLVREKGQWLPIDSTNSTIGGIIATNAYGPCPLLYGTARDMVLGMTVINGDGVIRKCGGKVVKNVTGYALDKLYIGSFGTLGLISEVTFKLQPLLPKSVFKFARLPSIEAGVEALQRLALKNLPTEMVQIYVRGEENGPFLFVCAAGTDAELNRVQQEVSEAVQLKFTDASNGTETNRPSNNREFGFNHRFTYASVASRVYCQQSDPLTQGATLRFGCLPSRLSAAVAVLRDFESAPQALGFNGGTISLSPLDASGAERIAAEFEKLGVNHVFENVVGVNIPQRWGKPRPDWMIMKHLKAALDPAGIMNPGRFVV